MTTNLERLAREALHLLQEERREFTGAEHPDYVCHFDSVVANLAGELASTEKPANGEQPCTEPK